TLAQMLGGIAVGVGIYFAWGNLKTSREVQITESFTRAIEHLGNEKIGDFLLFSGLQIFLSKSCKTVKF
ncbi:MAG: hypothetical protein Q8910_16445, partial [Bacteroidota bacterium]|nr:hypothetical protein [Bacteroidota bacterium]